MDSSFLVAIAFAEPGYARRIRRLESFDGLFSSPLLEAELRAALVREGAPAETPLLRAVAWVLPARPLSGEIHRALATGYLRGADLWHVACALYLASAPRDLVFLTDDKAQAKVAEALGFGL